MHSALLIATLSISGISAPPPHQLELVPGSVAPDAPYAVIVHGIDPVMEDLRPLAEDLVARGFRTHFFHYSTTQRLEVSARELARVLRSLHSRQFAPERTVVIGYSLGGLVARRALTNGHPGGLAGLPVSFELVTIASPLGGFRSANLWWLSLGLARPAFRDLGTESSFIEEPGDLARNVHHTKIETIEDGALRLEDGRWKDDDVVDLSNQTHERVDPQAKSIYRVEVGHSHIVNAYGNVHQRLVEILDSVVGAPAATVVASTRNESVDTREAWN